MNENVVTIRLRAHMDRADGWGHAEGQEVLERLLSLIEAQPAVRLVRISLHGVERTDASFPRESVVELAKRFRGTIGFCLTDAEDQDLLDNWDAAARKKEQPLIAWNA